MTTTLPELSTNHSHRYEYVYRATLKAEFGLTDRLIRLLGAPDKTVQNPRFKSRPPASLYERARVERFLAEHSAEIGAVAGKRVKRREAAAKGVARKRENLIREAERFEVEIVRPLPETYGALLNIAYDPAVHRHGLEANYPGRNGALSTLRHEYTNYEKMLGQITGRVGTGDAYDVIRRKLDAQLEDLLDEHYPEAGAEGK